MNTPLEIMTALQGILAEVEPLTPDTVSIGDWSVRDEPYSAIIFPPISGEQQLLHVAGWEQVHRIRIKLTVKHQDRPTLYRRVAEMLPLILTVLQANDTLRLPDVLTCHRDGLPVTYDSPTGEDLLDEFGVFRKEVDFMVSVVTIS